MLRINRFVFVAMHCFFAATLMVPPALAEGDGGQSEGSQLNKMRESQEKSRNASNKARNAGRDSIGKGTKHMHHGKAHHAQPEVSQGAMQIMQGLLGLLASAAAEKMADKDSSNGNNLDQITPNKASDKPGDISASSSPGSTGGDSAVGTGASSGPDAQSSLKSDTISSPEVKSALGLMNAEFGIPGNQLVSALASGTAPAEILKNAPLNPLTEDQAHAALQAANHENNSPESKSQILAQMAEANVSGLAVAAASAKPTAESAAEIAVAAPASTAGENTYAQGGTSSSLRKNLQDALSKRVSGDGQDGEGEADPEVSDDIKAAFADKKAELVKQAEQKYKFERQQGLVELDLFEAVHLKYREREKHLRWGEPLGQADVGMR